MSDSNSQYRNSLFCTYFNDPVRLLSLCNAVLDTDFSDPAELEITNLDGIFFDERKNDISCKIRNNFLVLVEHQSSVNANMPLRCLAYVTDLLNKLVENKRLLYRQRLIKFPSPKFFVLYDGKVKEGLSENLGRRNAILKAIRYCIANNVMKDYFGNSYKGGNFFENL
ncbi:MAG: hypothetical protein IJU91_00755 [Selenomonadaceae bacterium]|nr:hypothetical protein [Selenomonadaceae bacterium]